MSEYVLTINQKEYRAEVSEINAEYALIRVNGREFRVDLQQLALSKLMPVETKKSEARPEAAAAMPAVRPALEPPQAGGVQCWRTAAGLERMGAAAGSSISRSALI